MGLIVLAVVVVVIGAVLRLRSSGGEEQIPEAVTDVAVRVDAITVATLHRTVTAFGTVMPAPPGEMGAADATVGASRSGTLVAIDCAEGQLVSRGDTLFRLESRPAEVTLARARQELAYAEATLTRQQELLETGGTSRRALQEAERERDSARSSVASAETELALLQVTAPASGTVQRIEARLGQTVEPSTVLCEIVDLSRLVLAAAVPSREAALVEVGQRIEPRLGGAPLGEVMFVGTTVESRTDTVPVRASLRAGGGYRPGQLLGVRIVVEERPDCLVVPLDALVERVGQGTSIMRVEGERAVRTAVTAGLRSDGLVEVQGEGLAEGMLVVTDDAYSLPAETRIHVIGR